MTGLLWGDLQGLFMIVFIESFDTIVDTICCVESQNFTWACSMICSTQLQPIGEGKVPKTGGK